MVLLLVLELELELEACAVAVLKIVAVRVPRPLLRSELTWCGVGVIGCREHVMLHCCVLVIDESLHWLIVVLVLLAVRVITFFVFVSVFPGFTRHPILLVT